MSGRLRAAPAVPVALDVVGSAVVLVLLTLTWQRATVRRGAPFGDVVADLSGRTLAPAAFGLALVTLAGAVAALAVRGRARRVVGVLVALAGVGTAVAAALAVRAVGDDRARALASAALADRAGNGTGATSLDVGGGAVAITVTAAWPVLAAVAALLTVVAGVLWTWPAPTARRGGLSSRYEAPTAAARPRDESMWSALDHGEDPTVTRREGADPIATRGSQDANGGSGGPQP